MTPEPVGQPDALCGETQSEGGQTQRKEATWAASSLQMHQSDELLLVASHGLTRSAILTVLFTDSWKTLLLGGGSCASDRF